MKGMFNLDSPVMQALSRLADLVILNVLWLLLCLPVVTIGASTTAMYRVLLDFVKDEDQGTIRRFFRAFASNFKPATLTFLVLLVPTALVAVNIWLLLSNALTGLAMLLLCLIPALLLVFIYAWVFPYVATFDNTIWRNLVNALLLSLGNLPRTLAMTMLNLLPLILFLVLPQAFFSSSIVWFFIGFAGVSYVNALLAWPVFKKIIAVKEEEQ